MKTTLHCFLSLVLLSLFLTRCFKDEFFALEYEDLPENTRSIDIDHNGINDIIMFDTMEYYFIPGDSLLFTTYHIKSVNPDIQISWGKLENSNSDFSLDKDSVINETLNWRSRFRVTGGGSGPFSFTTANNPPFIGIKYSTSKGIRYGWINKNNGPLSFHSWALQPHYVSADQVFAGRILMN